MTVAMDLQDMVADVSVAITERKAWGRAELEVLRRRLTEAAREMRDAERAGTVTRSVLDDLVAGIDRGVADLSTLSRRARELTPAGL